MQTFIICYAKNFVAPPSRFGVGNASKLLTFEEALEASSAHRHKVIFSNNGTVGGAIDQVIASLRTRVGNAGKSSDEVATEADLLAACPSSLLGDSECYGAVVFGSSPGEGGTSWKYTMRVDGVLGHKLFVDKSDNDAQIYVLPFQRAIEDAIRSFNTSEPYQSLDMEAFPFTDKTSEERRQTILISFARTLIKILAVAFYLGVCGVTYQLTGHVALERELGLSQLIEAMAPRSRRHTHLDRILSNHVAFDVIYLPGWVVVGAIACRLVFPSTSMVLLISYHVLLGLALSSFSIFGASFFRKAQLSGICVTMATVAAAILAQAVSSERPLTTGPEAILSLLCPSTNYILFLKYLARFQRVSMAANLGKDAPRDRKFPNRPSSLIGVMYWIFLLAQVLVYPILGMLTEKWLYGTASKAWTKTVASRGDAIVLTNFSKHWTPGWIRGALLNKVGLKPAKTVVAVTDLTLRARKGQILVLLGANGSGKSTTLDAVSGLSTITQGTIEIDGTGGLGMCPQKNVLWDELTVFEHVMFFNRLKSAGEPDDRSRIVNLIQACDLGHKIDAKAGSLSGGQRRKLQLAMMFTGGSLVCCIDEVSSGLDPLSRRKIWDIILAERGKRTFLLTTHFLDEADVLSDHVAILSRGSLAASGTAAQLKHELGAGYHISVPKAEAVTAEIGMKPIPGDEAVEYWFQSSTAASEFMGKLQASGVTQYEIAGPTIEDVFLAVAGGGEDDADQGNGDNGVFIHDKTLSGPSKDATLSLDTVSAQGSSGTRMSKGRDTNMVKQATVLVRKRFTVLKRNFRPYLAAVLLPIMAAGLATLFIQGQEAVKCGHGAQASQPRILNFISLADLLANPRKDEPPRNMSMLVGPSSRVDVESLARKLNVNVTNFVTVESLDEFKVYISTFFRNISPGGFFLPDGDSLPVVAYLGNPGVGHGLLTQNALMNVLDDVPITSSLQTFATPWNPNMGQTMEFVLYFALAMAVYPAFFAIYPCVERLKKVRALHYSNGIRAVPLWIAYTAFDLVFVLIISAAVTIIFISASEIWYQPAYLFLIFFLYGLTSTLFSYAVSLVASSQLACFALAAGYQAAFILIYFSIYMSILTFSPANLINSTLDKAHFALSVITPSGNLMRTLLLTVNAFSLLCRDDGLVPFPSLIDIYGGPILYLIMQALVVFSILVWWDSGYKPALISGGGKSERAMLGQDAEKVDSIDPSVLAEVRRVEDGQNTDSLRLLHLHKSFGASNHAVQDMTFGIPRGQVFALLGPNGAGKSTTISLVRGDEHAGGGDILINGISVVAHRAAARQHLGVCPQFDAMDQMTVREHLAFYAAVRGVADVEERVRTMLVATDLRRFEHRLAEKLSGGNRRKLSLGIALMGNPDVLLLDEPSSGMDAAAKRVMWKTLLAVAAPGRSLLITTHSMEEADHLATRVGIMRRSLLALGTSKELRQKWGDGCVVQIVLKSAPETSEEEMDRARNWIAARVNGVVFDRWGAKDGAHGLMRFQVSNKKSIHAGAVSTREQGTIRAGKLGEKVRGTNAVGGESVNVPSLIQFLETNRDEVGLAYYSVSPTTLDEVFLRVVSAEEEEV